jgi:hypothetical protein
MLLGARTLTDCSLPGYLQRSVNKALFVSFFNNALPDIQSQNRIAWLLIHSWLAKMHHATRLGNNSLSGKPRLE